MITLVCAPACATQKNVDKTERPSLDLYEIEEPPASSGGVVLGITPESDQDLACLNHLGLPEAGGYFLSDSKLKVSTELRVYAEDTYTDAVMNSRLCELNADILWKRLSEADAKLKEIETERSSWWYQNKGTVFVGLGYVLGTATTILVIYGVNEATAPAQ